MPNAKKVELVDRIKNDLDGAHAMWVVDYRGLSVKEAEQLRHSLREAEAEMKVYKNTFMQLASADRGIEGFESVLEGPSAFVFVTGDDPVASAKALKDFAKGNENLKIKGGIMDGSFVNAAQVEAIASLPSREELLAKLVGSLANPLVQTVRVLNAPMEAFARCVSAIAEQKTAA